MYVLGKIMGDDAAGHDEDHAVAALADDGTVDDAPKGRRVDDDVIECFFALLDQHGKAVAVQKLGRTGCRGTGEHHVEVLFVCLAHGVVKAALADEKVGQAVFNLCMFKMVRHDGLAQICIDEQHFISVLCDGAGELETHLGLAFVRGAAGDGDGLDVFSAEFDIAAESLVGFARPELHIRRDNFHFVHGCLLPSPLASCVFAFDAVAGDGDAADLLFLPALFSFSVSFADSRVERDES